MPSCLGDMGKSLSLQAETLNQRFLEFMPIFSKMLKIWPGRASIILLRQWSHITEILLNFKWNIVLSKLIQIKFDKFSGPDKSK
jgi:hypothetical protein